MQRSCFVLLACVVIGACGSRPQFPERAEGATGLRYLGGDGGEGFDRAREPREFVFPADHGPHPTFRTEWWYFTGNLATAEGRHFGFELTFFRYALAPTPATQEPGSGWRSNQYWMAHFAVTDTESGRFTAVERFARQSLGVAGARAAPLRVWVEDWSAAGQGDGGLSVQLVADDEEAGIGLALDLASDREPVPHGEGGLDRKGPSPGNASYYYSIPRIEARGRIRAGGQEFAVEGLAWLDREWSTSALEGDVVGWDWFALHLSDGASLMFYRLRERSGGTSAFSGGTFVDAQGRATRLTSSAVDLAAEREWRSAATGVRYPVAWRLRVPAKGLDMSVEPYLDGQELDLSVRYWEGAVRGIARGPGGEERVQGYVELAGY